MYDQINECHKIYDLISWHYFKKKGRNKGNLSKRERAYLNTWYTCVFTWKDTRCTFFKHYHLKLKLTRPEFTCTYDNKGYMG